MPGPQKQFDTGEALAACMATFRSKGYSMTRFEDLVAATGVNRSSLYGTFGNKDEIFLQSLQLYVDQGVETLTEIVLSGESALEGIINALQFFAQVTCSPDFDGCLCGKSSSEVAATNPKAAHIIGTFHQRFVRLFRRAFDKAIEAKELDATVDGDYWANLIFVVVQGMSSAQQGGLSSEVITRTIDGLCGQLSSHRV
jgi:TetR/AcrR family transcriptional repressor of nem operon